jgi:uncharacterized repeat protein (TIGR02543 family)
MATVSKWTPFGVALDLTATGGTVTRTSATQYTVKINVSWETYYSGAQTNYGMTATSGGVTHTISKFDGTKRSSGSGSFTGTYSISGNGSATKTITVTFKNFNTDNGDTASKNVTFNVAVPAWTSYTIKYNANGGTGAPSSQTKWKDQTLKLSTTKPTRTGHSFLGWSTSSTATSATYAAGANYTANAAATLYAVWKANTYTVSYNANGGTGAPSAQTKTYGVNLTLSSTKPTRTNYNFKGWATSSTATTVSYAAGASYTTNSEITLYAVWELAYTKPRITGVSVTRCDANGSTSDSGTYALVKFNWATDKTVTSVKIEWESTSSTIDATGTSGSVNTVIGAGALSTEQTYTISITVADSLGSTPVTVTLNGTLFVVDFINGGDGIAFGKPAELHGYADFNFSTRHRKSMLLDNSAVIYGKSTDDVNQALLYINASDTINVGYGSYRNSIGATTVYGNSVNLTSRNGVYVDGKRIAANQVLWSGSGWYMSDTQTCTLSSAISSQANGIILVWSEYNTTDGAAVNANFNTCFIPKHFVSVQAARGVGMVVVSATFNFVASKYLYISDTSILGYSNNNAAAAEKTCGITTSPKNFVLRYIIGV